MKLKSQFITAIFIALVVYIPAAQAQANLTFSGGNGTPLSTTLQQLVVYTVTDLSCLGESNTPIFVFQGAGNPLGDERQVTGTISFSYSNGPSRFIDMEGSGNTVNEFSLNDLYLYRSVSGAATSNTIVLSAGTITTASNVSAAPPAGGSFTTFIVSRSGRRCSPDGVATTPTAATVSMAGRVVTAQGRGIRNAIITMTDLHGNTRTVQTSSLGYYHFSNVAAGETYVIAVRSKRYEFAPQVLNMTQDIGDLNFYAEP